MNAHLHALLFDTTLLLVSVGVLALGPLLADPLRRRPGAMAAIESFVLVAVLVLVLGHVLPESAHLLGGVWAIGLAAVGFVLPALAEHLGAHPGTRARKVVFALVFLALLPHFVVDGMALVTHRHGASGETFARVDPALPIAVLLHRAPTGLFVWWTIAPWSRRAARLVLVAIGIATFAGFLIGELALASTGSTTQAAFQAFAAGSLLHILRHTEVLSDVDRRRHRELAFAGVVAALIAALVLPGSHSHEGPFTLLWDAMLRIASLAGPLTLVWIVFLTARYRRMVGLADALDRALDVVPWLVWALVAASLALSIEALLAPPPTGPEWVPVPHHHGHPGTAGDGAHDAHGHSWTQVRLLAALVPVALVVWQRGFRALLPGRPHTHLPHVQGFEEHEPGGHDGPVGGDAPVEPPHR